MVFRTGITCRHQIQQNKNTEHSIHELKCIAMCLPPSGRWEQGDLEQLLGRWEQAEAIWSSPWADGNKRRRMGTGRAGAVDLADGPLLGDADGWKGGVRATTFRRRRGGMGWRGLASLRSDAEGMMWSGRWLRAGDQETGVGGWSKTGAY